MTICVGGVERHAERILFVRQATGHPLAGQWTFRGGFVDPGESPADAALREVLGESGVRAELEGPLGLQELEETGWLGLAFLCRHVDGKPASDGRETDRASYLSLAEIESFDEPSSHGVNGWCAASSRITST